jgi:hypothetical protein
MEEMDGKKIMPIVIIKSISDRRGTTILMAELGRDRPKIVKTLIGCRTSTCDTF